MVRSKLLALQHLLSLRSQSLRSQSHRSRKFLLQQFLHQQSLLSLRLLFMRLTLPRLSLSSLRNPRSLRNPHSHPLQPWRARNHLNPWPLPFPCLFQCLCRRRLETSSRKSQTVRSKPTALQLLLRLLQQYQKSQHRHRHLPHRPQSLLRALHPSSQSQRLSNPAPSLLSQPLLHRLPLRQLPTQLETVPRPWPQAALNLPPRPSRLLMPVSPSRPRSL